MQVIKSFESYNFRRYSLPWVCRMTETGEYNFKERVGSYSAEHGKAGDLVVFDPVPGQVYGYGQKDHRGYNNSLKRFAKWDGEKFVPCDKFGREIESEE